MNDQQLAAVKQALEALKMWITPNWAGTGVDKANSAHAALQSIISQDALDKKAENARELGLSYDDEPKIGCVNHDCDQCKAVQEPAPQTWELTTPATALSGGGGSGVVEVEWFKRQAPDYAWPTIADYEKEVGFEVNDAFKAAWTMARTTNDLFKQIGANT